MFKKEERLVELVSCVVLRSQNSELELIFRNNCSEGRKEGFIYSEGLLDIFHLRK